MSASNIEWTDETWNPTTGCTKISPGCAHCYIDRTPPFRMAGRRFEKGHIPLQLHENRLEQPLSWRKPRRVFVNSLSDLFHDDVPDDFLDRVFLNMALARIHTFQILTKRPERLLAYYQRWQRSDACVGLAGVDEREGSGWRWPLRNVWLGVSVEDQRRADERIPLLLQVPTAVRFLSCEPLLGAVELGRWLRHYCDQCGKWVEYDVPFGMLGGLCSCGARVDGGAQGGRVTLDWVIAGGESGPGARPCDLAWLRSVVAQCRGAGVPCFVKQLGARPVIDAPPTGDMAQDQRRQLPFRLRDKKGGEPAEWPVDLRVREFPTERDK
jgi:protein gp37